MSKDITLLEEIAEQDLAQVSGADFIDNATQHMRDLIEATNFPVDIGFTKNPVHFKSCKSWQPNPASIIYVEVCNQNIFLADPRIRNFSGVSYKYFYIKNSYEIIVSFNAQGILFYSYSLFLS